jgi:predicted dehydrogenase
VEGVIVGFGTIAMGHAVGYSQVDNLDVIAVVDPSPARRADATCQFGLRSYASFAEMLDHEDPAFIDVCTPPSSHAKYLRLGMAHGLHVLCEKPMLLPSADSYDLLLAEIRASEQIVYPCHNYKFAPILGLMEKVVGAPDFGTVLSARFRTMRSGHAVGIPDWNPHWRRDPALSGGGILRDHGPHSIYLATHLTRRTPVAVSCLTGNLRRDQYTDTEDTAMLTIRCNDGVQIMLDLTWSAGFRNSYYSVVGSNGSVVVENDDVCYTVGGDVKRMVLPSNFDDPSHTDWFRQMFLDFLDKVAHPDRLGALLQEALMTSLVIDNAYTSAADGGCWVTVEVPATSSLGCDVLR